MICTCTVQVLFPVIVLLCTQLSVHFNVHFYHKPEDFEHIGKESHSLISSIFPVFYCAHIFCLVLMALLLQCLLCFSIARLHSHLTSRTSQLSLMSSRLVPSSCYFSAFCKKLKHKRKTNDQYILAPLPSRTTAHTDGILKPWLAHVNICQSSQSECLMLPSRLHLSEDTNVTLIQQTHRFTQGANQLNRYHFIMPDCKYGSIVMVVKNADCCTEPAFSLTFGRVHFHPIYFTINHKSFSLLCHVFHTWLAAVEHSSLPMHTS